MRRSLLLILTPLTLGAQRRTASLDVGVARMRFADSIDATTMSISPAMRVVDGRASLNAYGTFSRLGESASNSGVLSGTWGFGGQRVFAELEGNAGGSFHSDGARTGQLLGLARLNAVRRTMGAWLGGGIGRTWDGTWRGIVQGDAGVWFVRDDRQASLRVAPTVVDDTIRYADFVASGGLSRPRWDIDASFGVRTGDQLPTLPANRDAWGGVGASWWASPQVALVASAGTYPVDFTQGFPGGRYVSLGVRLRARQEIVAPPPLRDPATRSVTEFRVQRESASTHRLLVRAPSARSVEVTGDFTGWRPVTLSATGGGWWTTVLGIAEGTHEVNVRVDAGEWGAPPGLTLLRDEFGGRVGLLVVSR